MAGAPDVLSGCSILHGKDTFMNELACSAKLKAVMYCSSSHGWPVLVLVMHVTDLSCSQFAPALYTPTSHTAAR